MTKPLKITPFDARKAAIQAHEARKLQEAIADIRGQSINKVCREMTRDKAIRMGA